MNTSLLSGHSEQGGSFATHAFEVLNRSYCVLPNPFQSLANGLFQVFAYALTDPLTDTPAALLEDKRREPRLPECPEDPVEEAESLVAEHLLGSWGSRVADEAARFREPRLARLAAHMASGMLSNAPLPHGPIPFPDFSVVGQVAFAMGLVLRRDHPVLAASLAEETCRFVEAA